MAALERIKKISKNKGWSLQDTASKAGIGVNSIYKWNKQTPSADSLSKVADALDVSLDYLLGKTDNPTPQDEKPRPSWVNENDVLELKDFLNSNVNMAYGGVELTPEQKQRVDEILTGVFWEELKKERDRDHKEQDHD